MNTRRLLLAALFAAALSAGGCTGYTEPPKGEEKPNAGDLPQAPPPHVKKTTAELLVGKWRVITDDDGKPLPLVSPVYLEFTQGGRFTVVVDDPRAQDQSGAGTYMLKDNTIKFMEEATPNRPGKTWEVKIETITESELFFSSKGGKPPKCSRLVRLEKK